MKSGKYRVIIDGKEIATDDGKKAEFDPAKIPRLSNGNTHHVQVIAENLDPKQDHILEIKPLLTPDQEQELRIESICVAGGDAEIFPWSDMSVLPTVHIESKK